MLFSFFPFKCITLYQERRLFSKTKIDLAPSSIFLLAHCEERKEIYAINVQCISAATQSSQGTAHSASQGMK